LRSSMERVSVVFIVTLVVWLVVVGEAVPSFRAGVAKLDGTLPDSSGVGVPLAGFNHGARRYQFWPLFDPDYPYCNWMNPSEGVIDPTWVKALVIDNGQEQFAFVTVDAIGSSGPLMDLAYQIAKANGFTVPRGNVMLSAAHTHSGPGAISPDFLWAIAPATDLMIPELQFQFAKTMATALVQAQQSLKPAKFGIGSTRLVGVTRNRRGGFSPYVTPNSIDPHLGVIRIDAMDGSPIATVWNFAIHGVCYGPSNMKFSGDIMGKASQYIEEQVGGIALFINADAGDIDPTAEACSNMPEFKGAAIIAKAVATERASLAVTQNVSMRVYSKIIPFGFTSLNITLSRFADCKSGGPLDICTICEVLQCDLNLHLDSAWVEQNPLFTALAFEVNGKNTLLVTLPGEPLLELGWEVRNDTKDMGFDDTFLCGYSNSHMGYFATPNEYDVGGYESQLSFWGRYTAELIRNACDTVAAQVKPTKKKY
jgi:neutral ceramidase